MHDAVCKDGDEKSWAMCFLVASLYLEDDMLVIQG